MAKSKSKSKPSDGEFTNNLRIALMQNKIKYAFLLAMFAVTLEIASILGEWVWYAQYILTPLLVIPFIIVSVQYFRKPAEGAKVSPRLFLQEAITFPMLLEGLLMIGIFLLLAYLVFPLVSSFMVFTQWTSYCLLLSVGLALVIQLPFSQVQTYLTKQKALETEADCSECGCENSVADLFIEIPLLGTILMVNLVIITQVIILGFLDYQSWIGIVFGFLAILEFFILVKFISRVGALAAFSLLVQTTLNQPLISFGDANVKSALGKYWMQLVEYCLAAALLGLTLYYLLGGFNLDLPVLVSYYVGVAIGIALAFHATFVLIQKLRGQSSVETETKTKKEAKAADATISQTPIQARTIAIAKKKQSKKDATIVNQMIIKKVVNDPEHDANVFYIDQNAKSKKSK